MDAKLEELHKVITRKDEDIGKLNQEVGKLNHEVGRLGGELGSIVKSCNFLSQETSENKGSCSPGPSLPAASSKRPESSQPRKP